MIVPLWLFMASAHAGTTVYKCVKDGQTTLTDKPCPVDNAHDQSTSPNMTSVVPSSKDPSPIGKWSGQVQFQETANSQIVQAAHSVALVRAEFTPDGKVAAVSEENGCQLLGIWSLSLETLVSLDLTLSHCAHDELNRRYHGTFVLARPDSSGSLNIQSIGAMLSKDVGKYFDVKGTLRR
jgi:hypothetical protein